MSILTWKLTHPPEIPKVPRESESSALLRPCNVIFQWDVFIHDLLNLSNAESLDQGPVNTKRCFATSPLDNKTVKTNFVDDYKTMFIGWASLIWTGWDFNSLNPSGGKYLNETRAPIFPHLKSHESNPSTNISLEGWLTAYLIPGHLSKQHWLFCASSSSVSSGGMQLQVWEHWLNRPCL